MHKKTVRVHIKDCKVCKLTKQHNQAPHAAVHTLPTPCRRKEDFSFDFITNFLVADAYNSIAILVDLFSKEAHFVPCTKSITAEQFAHLYITNSYERHGLSVCMLVEIPNKYTFEYFQELFAELGTTLNLSTTYHPHTDGQT